MTNKKPAVSIERHKEIADELRRLHMEIKALSAQIYDDFSIGGKRSKPWNEIRKAESALFSARVFAEQNYIADYPDQADPYTYFPNQDPGPAWPEEQEKFRKDSIQRWDRRMNPE